MILRVQWGQETCLGVIGGRWGVRGSKGAPGDLMGLSGWFEESSDDSWGICLYISDPNFSCGLTDGETDYNTGVFHEALVDLKRIPRCSYVFPMPFCPPFHFVGLGIQVWELPGFCKKPRTGATM